MPAIHDSSVLPPGYHLNESATGELILSGGAGHFAHGDVVAVEEAAELAWYDWLRAQPVLPDPIPAPVVFWLCLSYYDAVIAPEAPAATVAEIADRAIEAAAQAIHAPPETLQRWLNGTAEMPWSAGQLLHVVTQQALG